MRKRSAVGALSSLLLWNGIAGAQPTGDARASQQASSSQASQPIAPSQTLQQPASGAHPYNEGPAMKASAGAAVTVSASGCGPEASGDGGVRPCAPATPRFEAIGVGAVVLRLSAASVRGPGGSDRSLGLALAGAPEMFMTAARSSTRFGAHYVIGGGSGGFEGAIGASFTTGVRLQAGAHHGPFARVGAAGHLGGNDLFYHSLLSLPIGEVGYQYLNADAKLLFEIGARGGPSLTGRLNVFDEGHRALGGAFLASGYVRVSAPHVHARLDASRIFELRTGDRSPVDLARADACVTADGLALCVDGAIARGRVEASGGRMADGRVSYAGLSFGFSTP
jgi:hypothetical protein